MSVWTEPLQDIFVLLSCTVSGSIKVNFRSHVIYIIFDITSFPPSTWTEAFLDILCTTIISEPKWIITYVTLDSTSHFRYIGRNIAGCFTVIILGTYFPFWKWAIFNATTESTWRYPIQTYFSHQIVCLYWSLLSTTNWLFSY